MTSTIRSSVTVRGAPGRGSSVKPGRRRTRNRSRHLHTPLLETRSCLATARLVRPSAQGNTIRDRNANRCAVVGRWVHCSNVRRSSSVSQQQGFVVAFSRHAAQSACATAEGQEFSGDTTLG